MPIKQQSKKALRQSIARGQRNLKIKADLKTLIKKTRQAIDKNTSSAKASEDREAKDKISSLIKQAQKGLDKAAKKNILKKNTAARNLSRLIAYSKKTPKE